MTTTVIKKLDLFARVRFSKKRQTSLKATIYLCRCIFLLVFFSFSPCHRLYCSTSAEQRNTLQLSQLNWLFSFSICVFFSHSARVLCVHNEISTTVDESQQIAKIVSSLFGIHVTIQFQFYCRFAHFLHNFIV